jgi:dienelactone hydrolase
MKSQRVFLLLVLCATIIGNTHAQQTPKYVTTTANSGGYYEYLPSTYNSDSRNYPLIVFVHGLGELGNGTSADLPKLLNCWYALPRLIADGGFPASFNVDGQQQGFIILSPQFKAWPSGADINDIINYAVQNYRVNQNRIYVTGLSMGGGATWDFAAAYPAKAAAIVPVCGASWPDQSKAQAIANAKLPVWATHNDFDGTVPASYTKDWVANITNAGGIAKKTIWQSNSHDAWTKTYDPSYRENNLNVYEWMLQYQKTAAAPNKAPTANAGPNQTIILPTNSVSLTGSGADPDGNIVAYLWNQQSGPTGGTITSPSSAITTVTGLVQGDYVFRLTVTDNKGASASSNITVTVNAAVNKAPAANAGPDQTITLPVNLVTLNGSGNDADGSISLYEWTKLSGPSDVNFSNTSIANTTVSGLIAGVYTLQLTVTDNQGATATDTIIITVQNAQPSSTTANSFNSYIPYSGKYSYGLNPGWYGHNWSTQQIIDLGYGNNQVKGVGGKSFRMQIYDNYLSWYGDSSLLSDYEHLKTLGAKETAVMIGGPRDANKWDTSFYEGGDNKAKVFKGLYEPIFINGEVNPANTFAAYLYKVVKIYGPYIKFYEVWNEPDFTYGDGGWLGDTDPPHENSWFFRDPTPEDLVNLRTPVHYYIRMLRISWEVIKKYQPDAYVCTGGIGNRSFLDALLRNTDNPDGGKVTADFPLKAGAYFDVLSFHTYPEFLLRNWAVAGEPASADGFYYYRHSDSAIAKHLMIKNRMDDLLRQNGYDGSVYPIKQFICTETGMSRHTNIATGGYDFGGNEVQKNYMIKAHIKTQMDGQIKQTYWFSTADGDGSNGHWDQYGCYYYFGDKQPWNATATDQGIALKTTSDLLYGKTYDPARTASLNLPATIDGGAFKSNDGSYVYVLWAKTSTDLSETAAANFSFPEGLVASGFVSRKEWDFSQTGTALSLSSNGIKLSGSPSFFEVAAAPVTNLAPTANAGVNQTLTLPADSTTLTGTGTDTDGTIVGYKWSQIAGPSQSSIVSASQASTLIKSLAQGTYQFALEVTDNLGATGKDTVTVAVNLATNKPPIANAGTDQTITLPLNNVTLNGAGTDADGNITTYQWTKVSGPASYTITAPSSASTSVTGLVLGVYVFKLTLTDNMNSSASDEIQITVNAAITPSNIAPIANAGKDITITLPVNKAQLAGSGTDSDGTVVSYQWTAIDGPASYQITSPINTKTSVTGLVEGTYRFKLTVTDNAGASGSDTVAVVVKPDQRRRSNASIYPNPATTTINVNIDAVTDKNYSFIRIYNSMGNIVYQEEFLRTDKVYLKRIDISSFDKGVYFVNVNPDINTTLTMKFIKE